MDFIAHIVYQLMMHRFLVTGVSIPVVTILGVSLLATGKRPRPIYLVFPAIFLLVIFNTFQGPAISASLLYKVGVKGTAQIIGNYDTDIQYNNRNVQGHRVLIRTAENRTIETGFEDDDFNVYPSSNGVYYPEVGDVFTVHYIKTYPKDFVIVSNDDSPWAAAQRCIGLQKKLREAKNKYDFDTSNPSYRSAYKSAIRSFIGGKCYSDEDDLNEYFQDIANVDAEIR